MYESTVERFERTQNNDLFVTFVPILLVFGLRGVLKNQISSVAFLILQIVMALALIIWFLLSYRFYFRAFRYIMVDDNRAHHFPVYSLTFERLLSKKSRIYERVMGNEMLCLLDPGEAYDEAQFGVSEKPYVLTALSESTAMQLYYKQDGKVYCAKFHPDEEQIRVLQAWINENKS